MASNTNIEDLRFTIYINNQQANKALIDLDTVTRKLEADIKQMINTGQHETADYKAKKTALAAVSKEYYDLDVKQKSLAAQTKTLIAEGKQETATFAQVRKEFDQVTAAKSKAKVVSDALQKEINQLVAAGKHETAEFKAANAAMAQNKSQMQALTKQAGLHALSIKQLIALKAQLNREFKAAIPGSEGRIRLERELGAVNARLKQLTGTAKGFSLGKLADGFNKYFGIATAAIASFTGAAFTMKKLSEDVAKMDDVYADVMKTTGLTRDAVVDLNDEFKEMDTRTAREDLNKLASEAGKLGIEGKNNIQDFVDAGNQIKIALGEDLGEDAIKNIGKMVGVFEKSSDELKELDLKGQMLAVGSAINDLGAKSSASEDYLVQFAGRLGGVATQAGISVSAILGYGSALDQDMQQVEMAATALQTFIMKIMGDPAKFARLAGLEVGKFTQLLKTDANAAIKQVLTALNEKGGFQELIPVFEEMGLEGVRATGVLSSMAGSIDKIDEAQRLANQAMVEGTSITKEYDIKNENLAAKLDKAKKRFKEIALDLGEKLGPAFIKATSWTGKFMSLISGLIDIFVKYKSTIITVATGIAVYTLAVNASTIASKAYEMATKLATFATKAFNTAMKSSPWAALASFVFMAVVAIAQYVSHVNKASKAEEVHAKTLKEIEELRKSYSEQYVEESTKMNLAFNAAAKENTSKKDRKKAIQALIDQYPEYAKKLDAEKSTIGDIKKLQDEANQGLKDKLWLQMVGEEASIIAKAQKNLEDHVSGLNIYKEAIQKTIEGAAGASKELTSNAVKYAEELRPELFYSMVIKSESDMIALRKKAIGVIDDEIVKSKSLVNLKQKEFDLTQNKYNNLLSKQTGIDEPPNEPPKNGPSGGKTKAETDAENKLKAEIEFQKKKAEIEQQIYEMTLEGEDKEIASAMQKYDQLFELALEHGVDITELQTLQAREIALIHKKYEDQEIQDKKDAQQKKEKSDEEAHEKELKDLKDAEQKKRDERQKTVEAIMDIQNALSTFVSNLKEQDLADAEGNEKKQKEIKKKYADIELAINIARIGSETALAAIKAYTSMVGYSRILAIIAAAASVAVGGVQIYAATRERNRIKSLSAGGYTGPGEGLPDETGYKVAGKVHEKEYVTPEWELKIPEVAQYVKQIEKVRKRGYATRGDFSTASSRYSQAMLSGVVPQNYQMNTTRVMSAIKTQGYDLSRQSSATHTEMTFSPKTLEVMENFTNTMKNVSENGINGKWVLRDLKEIEDKFDEVKKNFGG